MKTSRARADRMNVLLAAVWLLAVAGCSERAERFGEGPVDLTKWTAINYDYPPNDQPYANWVLSEDKQSVTQTVNADPSIFLSDKYLDDISISGTWLVTAHDDDDLIGFVFAYQDPGRFYLFDWKSGTQEDSRVGKAEQGMSAKVVKVPYTGPLSGNLEAGKPFVEKELWDTQGSPGKVKLLDHEPTEGWHYDKPYHFRLDFRPGAFRIEVKDGERVIYDKTFHDSTYTSGRFGFYNNSQGGVVYRGFQATRLPPEHNYGWLMLAAAVALVLFLLIALAVILFGLSAYWLSLSAVVVIVLLLLCAVVVIVLGLGHAWLILVLAIVFALIVLIVAGFVVRVAARRPTNRN